MSEYALDLILENQRTRKPYLELGLCGMENEIPRQLYKCTWLQHINFGAGDRSLDLPYGWLPNKFTGYEFHALNRLPNLKSLSFNECSVHNIDFLEDIPGLTSLSFAFNKVTDISPLEHFTALHYLNIGGNGIQDISILSRFTRITELLIFKNDLPDIEPLSDLIYLRKLYASNNNIREIWPLKLLVNLEELHLDCNRISDLQPLEQLMKLRTLSLQKNQIRYLQALENLAYLKEIELADNDISDISTLQKLTALKKIGLERNRLRSVPIPPKQSWPQIWELRLSGNPIENIPEKIVNTFNCLEDLKWHLHQKEKVNTPQTTTVSSPPATTTIRPKPVTTGQAVATTQADEESKRETAKAFAVIFALISFVLIISGNKALMGVGIVLAFSTIIPLLQVITELFRRR